MKARILRGTVLATILAVFPAWPQPASQSQAAEGSASPPAQASSSGAQAGGAGARRDPFKTLIVKRTEQVPVCREGGKKALLIGQIQIQGIVRGINNEWIAVVDNNTNRAFFLREKDELCNGVITSITENNVAFEEKATDAFGRSRTREVVKQLPPD